MSLRFLPLGFTTCGLALLGLAAYDFFLPAAEPRATIDQPERTFEALAAGRTYDVVFQLRNPTNQVVRVVGMETC